MKKFAAVAISGALLAGAGMVSPAFAEENNNGATPIVTSAHTNGPDVACIQSALDKRETNLIAAIDPFATSIKSALSARTIALKDAWTKTTVKERREARALAWKTYKTSAQNAHQALKTAKKTAWSTFKTDMKACGQGNYAATEATNISTSETSL